MVTISMNELSYELTDNERKELEDAARKPVVYDEDCPELTEEMLAQFKRVNREERVKQTVSLRLSPYTVHDRS